jgi:hypothetical protein
MSSGIAQYFYIYNQQTDGHRTIGIEWASGDNNTYPITPFHPVPSNLAPVVRRILNAINTNTGIPVNTEFTECKEEPDALICFGNYTVSCVNNEINVRAVKETMPLSYIEKMKTFPKHDKFHIITKFAHRVDRFDKVVIDAIILASVFQQ